MSDAALASDPKVAALFRKPSFTVRDLDLDAFADGIVAHRNDLGFHECPFPDRGSWSALSWRIGWNERALTQP